MKKTKADLFSILDNWTGEVSERTGKVSREIFCDWLKNQKDEYYNHIGQKITGGHRMFTEWSMGKTIKGESKFMDKTIQTKREIDPKESILNDRRVRALTSERDEAKKKYRVLLDEFELLEKRFDAVCAIREPVTLDPITPNYKQGISESIAVAQLSDIHVGERVDPDTVNGLNEFNPDICDKRVYNYFQNLLRLIDSARRDTKIETLFLSLTGDNITGYIHEELMESNYMSPIEETIFAKKLLFRGIDFLLNHGKFKKILIQTNFGNHGRTTKKFGYATAYKNSYDYMIYKDMAKYFENEKSIEFNISKSHICYSQELFGKVIRTFHGDTFNYAGGIGGLSVPLIKYVHRMQQQQYADMNLIGHWHQRIRPIKSCLVNGSIIGLNAYAQGIGCEPEPPMQNLIFLDKARGFTGECPVFCD